MFCWYAREKRRSYFSQVACEDCLEVCFCGTSGRNDLCMVPCHSCHIYGIWTSRSKEVYGMLNWGWRCKSQKGGLFSKGRQALTMEYCSIMKLYCKSYWLYAVKDFIGYLFSLYCCCFTCLRLAKPKVQLKVS